MEAINNIYSNSNGIMLQNNPNAPASGGNSGALGVVSTNINAMLGSPYK
jgi:hypothetical protein